MSRLNKQWTTHAERALLNKRIIKVEYMSKQEAKDYDWYHRPITFILDDGTRVIPQADDEGNSGGALWFGNNDEESIMPVLRGDD